MTRGRLLLVLTLPAFVVYVVVAVVTVAAEAESSSAELTPAQLSDLALGWIALHLCWIAPSVLAAAGLARVADRAALAHAALVRRLAVVTVLLAVLYLVPQLLAPGVGTTTWGKSRWYAVGVALSLATGWAGTLPATMLVARGLTQRGVAPRVARVLVVPCALYLVWEVATYLRIALSSATLVDTVGPPPFLLGLVWAVLGLLTWRRP